MGENALVESQISDSIALVKQLDSGGDSPTLAAWFFYDDAGEWRLLISGPSFDSLLPKQEPVAYRKAVEAITAAHLSSLTISEVKIVASQSALPQTVRMLIRTDPKGIARAHFTDTMINRLFIKEMIVLRAA